METIELRPNLFRDTPSGPTLLGGRCSACGQLHFPAGRMCLACLKEDLEMVELGADGELFCETTVHMKTPHFDPPYSVGYIQLPQGLKVFSPLRSLENAPFRVGMPMKLEVVPLWQEDDKQVLAYRFHPA